MLKKKTNLWKKPSLGCASASPRWQPQQDYSTTRLPPPPMPPPMPPPLEATAHVRIWVRATRPGDRHNMYMHIQIHIQVHIHITYTKTRTHPQTHTHTYVQIHIHITYTYTHTHTLTNSHTHTCVHIHIHEFVHVQRAACTTCLYYTHLLHAFDMPLLHTLATRLYCAPWSLVQRERERERV